MPLLGHDTGFSFTSPHSLDVGEYPMIPARSVLRVCNTFSSCRTMTVREMGQANPHARVRWSMISVRSCPNHQRFESWMYGSCDVPSVVEGHTRCTGDTGEAMTARFASDPC
jgi:hypothetical protein